MSDLVAKWLWTLLLVVIVAVPVALVRWRYGHWTRRGVKMPSAPEFPYGHLRDVGKRVHMSQRLRGFYDQYKHRFKFVGIFFVVRPVAVLFDLDLVKAVLVKDFNHFQDRGVFYNEKDDPMSAHLFSIEGDRWKFLRAKLTPTFTSGKMKLMFPIITELGDKLVRKIGEQAQAEKKEGDKEGAQQLVDVKNIFARFTTDIIGNCAFGIDCNSLNDANAEFLEMGERVFQPPKPNAVYRLLTTTFRGVSRFLGLKAVDQVAAKFFFDMVKETVAYRETNHVKREDFLSILMDMRAKSELTFNELAAQVFLFQVAGFETSSTTLTFAFYELALNQDIQQIAREEVATVLARHSGAFTYEAMMEMRYLDNVIDETLRKYPPGSNLLRIVSKDYQLTDTVTLKRGSLVMIPVRAIHLDPVIYTDPETFNPDRFGSDEAHGRHPMAFLPFGEGPRICIGIRFALMEIKVGMAKLLTQFRIDPSADLQVPLVISPKSFVLSPADNIALKFSPLK